VKKSSSEQRSSGKQPAGLPLVAQVQGKRIFQIALRPPAADLERARAAAELKGVGCLTLITMPAHEGLVRELTRE